MRAKVTGFVAGLVTLVLVGGSAIAGVYDHYPYQYWSPYQGIVHVNHFSVRFAYNDMNWASRTGYFFNDGSSKNGYEHENWFYDYCDVGGCAYSRSATNFFTNLPGSTDLDNNYSNPSGEVNLEVMTLDGHLIQGWTWYYADMHLQPNSSWSWFKLRSVRTTASVSCTRWWCPFEHDGRVILNYNGPYDAPGGEYIWSND